MKYVIAFILIMPCALIIADGGILYNVLGVIYTLILFFASRTVKGQRFCRSLYKSVNKMIEKYANEI